jgi:chromosomal replication initiator protein
MWFDRSARLDYDGIDRRLDVSVPNDFVADWIGRNFSEHLREAATTELGEACGVAVRVDPYQFAHEDTATRTSSETEACEHPAPARPAQKPASPRNTPDRFKHRLEEFIVGPCNELAHAAALRLVHEENPALVSPLFIYGGCGLGKTHLLQGTCHQMRQLDPQAKVHYTTGEQFTNQYIQAVRNHKLEAFRRRVRQLDLLAVDDVHFLANKDKTQQEFQHCFDAIELSGSRVVMASDSHPRHIRQFAEALVSRCMRGMVVEVRQPDTETRLRIVRALAKRRGIDLMETVVAMLSSRCNGSVRDIEGTINRLHALANLAGMRSGETVDAASSTVATRSATVGHALVQQLFEAEQVTVPRKVVKFEAIVDVISEEMAVAKRDILGSSRNRRIVLARSMVIHLARTLTTMSYPEIAAAMGRTSHSTIVTAFKRMQEQLRHESDRPVTLPEHPTPMPLSQAADHLRQMVMKA